MLKDLKFVQGAVSKKDYQPALRHFRIRDGRVTGYNGTIALSSPIPLEINATPQATPFVKAIERCQDETTTVHLTPGNKLALRSGAFRAYIECTDESELLDSIVPEGSTVDFSGSILEAVRTLAPFIGTDQSRPWATGILLRNQSCYVTNNIIVAEFWIGHQLPEINLPAAAISELTRIKEEPTSILLSDRSVTFFFNGDRWMRTQLLGLDWPNVEPLLNRESNPTPFPEGFFSAVEDLSPFVEEEGRIYFRPGRITTYPDEGKGASIEIAGLPDRGAFHYSHLLSLQGRATTIDFTMHPLPCVFYGDKLRGIILGMVDA